jgi:hypothetical protein
VRTVCFEYQERMQRLDERRRRELLELQRREAEKDLERTTLERLDWTPPEEPARSSDEKIPA